ncbi:hypothetical protein LCGC14_1247400 [marine sediment metagenome]|uniref:Pyridoxamine 5'-phosphate oxidase N-terminal domain-containing protein n=1 Tax=marine sediment metagenome TaxID=412755 RepID=A0A0F9P813_9ZZZZ|nr:pyridoxamine 5'-phosphate oxidase family protein [Methylophaga sp.]HEC59427.1 pyridoxamine 5'-phosphate oxidase family protein [Methylophaga sp.]
MTDINDPYHAGSKKWQESFGTEKLAQRQVELIYHNKVTEEEKTFIESRDMFFLSTTNNEGWPTCSYKGGPVGFVRVIDEHTIAFPDYDGNGMFLSIGNMSLSHKVGMLFIDFENPQRLRLHGIAHVYEEDELLSEFAGAQLIIRVTIDQMFINCPRYIHHYKKIEESMFTPEKGISAPIPDWKNLEAIQDVLPEKNKRK